MPNPENRLRSGITTEIHIPVESILAQKVSPALFSLDDDGGIGIRTINEDHIVEFHRVNILADAVDGVWVSGLPDRAAVITVGQELVTAGELVDPVFQGDGTLNADAKSESTGKTNGAPAQAGLPVNMGVIAH